MSDNVSISIQEFFKEIREYERAYGIAVTREKLLRPNGHSKNK